MTAAARAASVPAGLRRVRENLDLEQQQAAAQLGVSTKTLRAWEYGRSNPPARQLIAYAHLLERRIMAGRNNIGRYDLAEILPNLAKFRKAHKVTQQQVAERMHVTEPVVGELERRARDGQWVGWHSLARYMAALGWDLGISKHTTQPAPQQPAPLQVAPGAWDAGAACKGREDAMFLLSYDTRHPDVKAAKAICADCPIREQCLQYALDNPWETSDGIWGGLTPSERRRLRGTYHYERTAA